MAIGREVLDEIQMNLRDLHAEWRERQALCQKILTRFRTLIASAHMYSMELESELKRLSLQAEVARKMGRLDRIVELIQQQRRLDHDLQLFNRELYLAEQRYIALKKNWPVGRKG